jgi:hypothetical protein
MRGYLLSLRNLRLLTGTLLDAEDTHLEHHHYFMLGA